ncbi:MAG: fibronectin type III domain-containing protein [Desulfitobacteriaceae bacterium]
MIEATYDTGQKVDYTYDAGGNILSVTNTPAKATAISLDATAYSLNVGDTHNTVVTAQYTNNTSSIVTSCANYQSSNTAVATVDDNGIVKGIAAGTAIITVTYDDKTVTVEVTVNSQVDTIPPTAVTDLTVSGKTDISISLSWTASTDNVGVTGYEIYQNGTKIDTTTATTYTSINLTPGTNYTYYVKAYDAANNLSDASNSISDTTLTVVAKPEICSTTIPDANLDLQNQTLAFSFDKLTKTSVINVSKDCTMVLNVSGVGTVGVYNLYAGQPNSFPYTLLAENSQMDATNFVTIINAMKSLEASDKLFIFDKVNSVQIFSLLKQQASIATKDAVLAKIDFNTLFSAIYNVDSQIKQRIFDNLTSVLDLALADSNQNEFKQSLMSALEPALDNHDLTNDQLTTIANYLDNPANLKLSDLFRNLNLTVDQKAALIRDINYTQLINGVMTLASATRTSILNTIDFTDLINAVNNSDAVIKDKVFTNVLDIMDTMASSSDISKTDLINTIDFGSIDRAILYKVLNNLDGNSADPNVTMTVTLTDANENSNLNTYTFIVNP